jgi:hypothetical protein
MAEANKRKGERCSFECKSGRGARLEDERKLDSFFHTVFRDLWRHPPGTPSRLGIEAKLGSFLKKHILGLVFPEKECFGVRGSYQ